jgi:hypothetical protein
MVSPAGVVREKPWLSHAPSGGCFGSGAVRDTRCTTNDPCHQLPVASSAAAGLAKKFSWQLAATNWHQRGRQLWSILVVPFL